MANSEKTAVTLGSVVTASKDQVSSDLAGEVVILNLRSGVYHGLEAVGARVWQLLADPVAVSRLREAILIEYEVEPRRCEDDLLALLSDLNVHGLVELLEAGRNGDGWDDGNHTHPDGGNPTP